MKIEKLARLDLNLLISLRILIEEQNVTRAAQRLCLSQSAVSKNLAKLRIQFEDPLLTRHAYGLKPTPKALFLKPKLEKLINQLEQLTQPECFDPRTSDYRYQIATVESVYPLILPHFLPEIYNQAPGITISTHSWDRDTFHLLQRGELDLGITGKDIDINDAKLTMLPPNDICEQEIYRDQHMCLMRSDHPALTSKWDLKNYLAQRHVQVRCDGNDRWLLDYRLADIAQERDIAITVPDFNSAASLCSYTDLVFTAPRHFLNLVALQLNLTVMPLPINFPPMAYTLFWHKDREKDPALVWLRKIIEDRTTSLREFAGTRQKE